MSEVHRTRNSLALTCLLLFVGFAELVAQSISIQVRMAEHPKKEIAEWADKENTLTVILHSSSESNLEFRLRTTIRKDSLIVAYTRFADMPLLHLNGTSATLDASSLLPPDAIEFLKSVSRSSSRNGILIPGNYSIQVQVLDAQNPDQILCSSEKVPFQISGFEVPQLLEPSNYFWLPASKPVMFRWKAIHPSPQVPRIVRYKVLVYEAPKGMDPNYVVETMTPIFEKFSDNVSPLSVVWSAARGVLRTDVDYVWTVQALDQDDHSYGDPDGLAEPYLFRIRKN